LKSKAGKWEDLQMEKDEPSITNPESGTRRNLIGRKTQTKKIPL